MQHFSHSRTKSDEGKQAHELMDRSQVPLPNSCLSAATNRSGFALISIFLASGKCKILAKPIPKLLLGLLLSFLLLGKISRRGNRYLRVLFVQAAWVVLIKPKIWERHGLKPWIEAAKRRLHHNVLAIALANKLARIAWSVLARGRAFEARTINGAAVQPA